MRWRRNASHVGKLLFTQARFRAPVSRFTFSWFLRPPHSISNSFDPQPSDPQGRWGPLGFHSPPFRATDTAQRSLLAIRVFSDVRKA